MLIEYDGSDFYGWQYQPDKRTVQGEIESAINRIINEPVRVIGAGRTDHGVHALGQVANFKTTSRIPCDKLKKAINALTGSDLFIKEICDVPLEFHARFSASSKIYQYKIMTCFSPLKRRYFWFVKYDLDLSSIRKSLQYFLGTHDFKNFSVETEEDEPPDKEKNTICKIFNISLTEVQSDIIIEIEADRFLRKMVRGIVGFLVDVGRGRFKPETAVEIFERGFSNLYFAPACGLYLCEVKYKDLFCIAKKEL
ncbi:MAG: tRNA pseudouridine(38-40) synthase TruA [candidate division WOR-3 bacterium]|nr:tRNA pseudouridine(38-40) synthase TruA [candidate division WOR-3 bacterium]